MRIAEENDRRRRQSATLERLPSALEEVREQLRICVETYRQAFGAEAAEIAGDAHKIRVTVREQRDGSWPPGQTIEITAVPSIPGFQVDRAGEPLFIEIGLLPGDKLFYRDRAKDQYVTMEELTRRILDRAFFPKLGE
jgi:hypothetical protein